MKFEINYKLDVLLTKCKSLTELTAFCAILFFRIKRLVTQINEIP